MIEAVESVLRKNIAPLNHRNLQSLSSMKDISILFIDDDFVNYSYYKELLNGITQHIFRAVSLTQTLQMLADNSAYSLIILSASLPENFNNFALKKIRAKIPHIPIISLISHHNKYMEKNLLKDGANLCISRSTDRDHIIEVFTEVLEFSRNAR